MARTHADARRWDTGEAGQGGRPTAPHAEPGADLERGLIAFCRERVVEQSHPSRLRAPDVGS